MPASSTTTFVSPPLVPGVGSDASISTQGLDLATLVLLVSLTRHEQLESGVVDQMNDIQAKNAVLAKFRDVMNKLKNFVIDDKKGKEEVIKDKEVYEALVSFYGDHRDMCEGFIELDGAKLIIKVDGGKEKVINNIQTAIEKLSGNSQVEMIRLQSSMAKANQMMDFASTFVHKADEVVKSIFRNM